MDRGGYPKSEPTGGSIAAAIATLIDRRQLCNRLSGHGRPHAKLHVANVLLTGS